MQNIIVVTVIKENDKILMVKEASEKHYGKYNFPAGHLEEGESIYAAAIREVKEETGYDVTLENLITIQNAVLSGKQMIAFIFTGKIIGGETNFDKDEILDVEWIEFDKLLKMSDNEVRSAELMHKVLEKLQLNVLYKMNIIEEFINEEESK